MTFYSLLQRFLVSDPFQAKDHARMGIKEVKSRLKQKVHEFLCMKTSLVHSTVFHVDTMTFPLTVLDVWLCFLLSPFIIPFYLCMYCFSLFTLYFIIASFYIPRAAVTISHVWDEIKFLSYLHPVTLTISIPPPPPTCAPFLLSPKEHTENGYSTAGTPVIDEDSTTTTTVGGAVMMSSSAALRREASLQSWDDGNRPITMHLGPVMPLEHLGTVMCVADLELVMLVADLGEVMPGADLGQVMLVADLGQIMLVADLGQLMLVADLGPVMLMADLGPVMRMADLGPVMLIADSGPVRLMVLKVL